MGILQNRKSFRTQDVLRLQVAVNHVHVGVAHVLERLEDLARELAQQFQADAVEVGSSQDVEEVRSQSFEHETLVSLVHEGVGESHCKAKEDKEERLAPAIIPH
ncbi:unnamed protein product [Phytophthora lilii]|uniref:Unnamed protein product n=1 Tax=Phytophthora lilii TaxID=2077276 RepID=A0A9W6XFP8_9STRA|nr:unnamed protein product [Phytophthora lilii]